MLPLRLNATSVATTEALLAFGPSLANAALTSNLSETANLSEAAANLFAALRWLDAEGACLSLTAIAAMPIPATALGAAINDRLQRAAAPRQEP